jgi:HSP20 family protein
MATETKVSVDMGSTTKETAPLPTRTRRQLPSAFAQMENEMNRFFPRWMRLWGLDLPRPWQSELPELRMPFEGQALKIDVIDRENEVLVRADLPGVNKEDVDVSLGDGTVTIKAVAHKEATEEKGEYYRREIASGEVSRTVGLPADIDAAGVKARFKKGVLEVTLPKAAQSRRHHIEIQ